MPAPFVTVTLTYPSGVVNLSNALSQETGLEITETIESPHETNVFQAPEVGFLIRDDRSGTYRAIFETMTPDSTNFRIAVTLDGVQQFAGYVAPNTLQFNDQEGSIGFTAIGLAGLLATVPASDANALKRPISNGWRVLQFYGSPANTLEIDNSAGPMGLCEIESGDTIQAVTAGGMGQQYAVQFVQPVGTSAPFASFLLSITPTTSTVEVGTPIELVTYFNRNVSLKLAVDELFDAAGLPRTTGSTYLASPIPSAAAPFATVPNRVGLGGTPLGIAPSLTDIGSPASSKALVGTTLGLYTQSTPPTGPWVSYSWIVGARQPVDWSPQGTGATLMYGPRYDTSEPAPNQRQYLFYAYDYSVIVYYRYVLSVTIDNVDGTAGATWNWTSEISQESSPDGKTWSAYAGPWATQSGTYTTNLHDEIVATCGIDFDVSTLCLFWTEPVTGPSVPTYQLSGRKMSSGTTIQGLVANMRGHCFCPQQGLLGVFSSDTLRGNVPTAYFYSTVDTPGVVALSSAGLPVGFVDFTLKYNQGDGFWYALATTASIGVLLLKFSSAQLGAVAGYTPSQLYPPSNYVNLVDMVFIRPTSGSGSWPALALFGNQIWWVAFSYAGIISYLDLDGLTCADALAQLATLVDGYFYVDASGQSWFRTRNTSSARSIASGSNPSVNFTDELCISIRRQTVFYKSYRYVKLSKEGDDTVYGEAGDPGYAGGTQALEISNRFVYPTSFAIALAQNLYAYLGRALTVVDAEHVADGRVYEVGRTFTATINGVTKTYQVIEATKRPTAGTVRVLGLEL